MTAPHPTSDLVIDVSWTFADDPHRVDRYDIRFQWPSLPAKRLNAAKRVAEMCTIHATLQHPPTIAIDGTARRELTVPQGETTVESIPQ